MTALTDPVAVGGRESPSRVVFGPHETNLAWGRGLSDRHVAYYTRRAAGGAGIVITETASVAPDDWPYERAPLASDCGRGWADLASSCRRYGTILLAGLGHAGGQGSSAYSQQVLWAPSPVADAVTREPPAALSEIQIDNLVKQFASAATEAVRAGMAGVEVDAGAWSLLRQFHSGLTNHRSDRYGTDRLAFTRQVLQAVRAEVGRHGIVALRLSCDELAPWAGVTPEQAAGQAGELADLIDLLTVVRAGPFSTGAYRPDAHAPEAFNSELCSTIRSAVGGRVPVVLQGSVVDAAAAAVALADGVCDLVEMTRAQIADARLVSKVRAGEAVRPCILCNQACRVRDNRNPIVSCVMDPFSGHETEGDWDSGDEVSAAAGQDATARGGSEMIAGAGREVLAGAGPEVLVVGAGPAGLECARVLAAAGRPVRVADRASSPGGTLARASVGSGRETLRRATDWLAAECARLGVTLSLKADVSAADVRAHRDGGGEVVLATGSRPHPQRWDDAGVTVLDPLSVLADDDALPDGPAVVLDPVGDQVGVGVAEWLAATGRPVTIVSPDPVVGTQLARTGDLADANGRLQRAGVTRKLRSLVRSIGPGKVDIEDCWTGEPSSVDAAVVVDCGHRLPEETLYLEIGDPRLVRVGDCVAPRSLLEAVLEGRRAANGILSSVLT